MNLNKSTALVLRVGIVIGIVLMAVGLCVTSAGGDDGLLRAGILVLIVSPLAGVVTSFICLLSERDTYWAAVAGVLLIVTMAGILTSL